MKLPKSQPLTYADLSKEEFDFEIEKGMKDIYEYISHELSDN